MYVFQLMDFYAASGMSLLWCTFFQTIAICWFFGGKKMYDCIEQMVGFRINWYWYVCWMVTAPAFMLVSTSSTEYISLTLLYVDIFVYFFTHRRYLTTTSFFIFSSCLYFTSQNTLRSLTQKRMSIPHGARHLDSALVDHQ